MNALAALADPTRRRIVELLAGGERSAGELAAQFHTSRPGVSRHLRVLREQGLVRTREDGARRLYSLDPAPLAELDGWLQRYRGFWVNRLDALDTEIRRRRRDDSHDDEEDR
ncbi:MAG: ArsR/SmtB family transcription factor [Solirubrobacteraceae bacterium]